jgi:type II secretion system protein I
MISGSNKAFTLLEVLIALAILSTAIVFIFRSFTSSISCVKFSQNITLACFFAENKIWELEQEQKAKADPISAGRQGNQIIQGKDFKWAYQAKRLGSSNLVYLEFIVYWQENLREKEYSLEFDTYLLPR